MYNDTYDNTYKLAENDYRNALREAFWRNLGSRLKRGCNDLLSYERVFKHLHQNAPRILGLQTIAVDDIVGSAGRYAEFDLAFRPRRNRNDGDERWTKIAHARRNGIDLPPVALYKVGSAYFVEDGNHRISVARTNGEQFIKAFVVEIDVSTLTAKPSCARLGYKV